MTRTENLKIMQKANPVKLRRSQLPRVTCWPQTAEESSSAFNQPPEKPGQPTCCTPPPQLERRASPNHCGLFFLPSTVEERYPSQLQSTETYLGSQRC